MWRDQHKAQNYLLRSKKRDVANAEPQMTSFSVAWPTQGPKWPLLVQRHDVPKTGSQLTSFDPKNIMWLIPGSNWPLLVQKAWRDQLWLKTWRDLLWLKTWCDQHNTMFQLTSFHPKNMIWPTQGPNWPPLVQKSWRYQHGARTDVLDV